VHRLPSPHGSIFSSDHAARSKYHIWLVNSTRFYRQRHLLFFVHSQCTCGRNGDLLLDDREEVIFLKCLTLSDVRWLAAETMRIAEALKWCMIGAGADKPLPACRGIPSSSKIWNLKVWIWRWEKVNIDSSNTERCVPIPILLVNLNIFLPSIFMHRLPPPHCLIFSFDPAARSNYHISTREPNTVWQEMTLTQLLSFVHSQCTAIHAPTTTGTTVISFDTHP